MNVSSPEQIVAYVEFLRAVDRLLADAESLREKRELLARAVDGRPDRIAGGEK